VRRSHLSGAPFVGLDGLSQRHLPSSEGHLIRRIRASQAEAIGGSGLRLGRFYGANRELIDRHRTPTLDFDTGMPTNRRYTRAKVIDMIFFVEGAG
jgi:hypothetical protein